MVDPSISFAIHCIVQLWPGILQDVQSLENSFGTGAMEEACISRLCKLQDESQQGNSQQDNSQVKLNIKRDEPSLVNPTDIYT